MADHFCNLRYVYFKHLRERLLAGKQPEIDFHEIIALIAPGNHKQPVIHMDNGNPWTSCGNDIKICQCYSQC